MHLLPYKFEERTKRSSSLLVSDRDPIVDTLCYSDFYLSPATSKAIKPTLRFVLEHSFRYPDSFIYLDAEPENLVHRNHQGNQLHERTEALIKLKNSFDEQIYLIEKKGVAVNRIDTNSKSLEEVTEEIRFHVNKF